MKLLLTRHFRPIVYYQPLVRVRGVAHRGLAIGDWRALHVGPLMLAVRR